MRIIELLQASFAQCFTSAPDVVPPSPRRPTKDVTPRTSSPTNLLGYDAAIITKTRSMAETEEELSSSPKSRHSAMSLAHLADAHDLAGSSVSSVAQEKTRPPPASWPLNWKTSNVYATRRRDSDTDTSSVSSTGSCSSHKAPLSAGSYKLSTTGVSFRQLTQELAPPPAEKTDAETVAAFYLVALQLLKQERELRARLRSESGSGMEIEAEPVTPETALPHMQVTPMAPEHEEDDEARRLRKKKLENLRQRTTRFAITVGKPLNYTNFTDLPEDDSGPCLV